ncbi:30S ribosomal protein S18 [candidate division WOR-3 bacterium JGI_Cruoil_03_44_89]|uniref:Small ribosomal subunit protein bS18 n=1 Tax=candidate division WOR-3 bacterium JGI_Cruoil_03_44_89 TaxID=1973748 RepID=A0A235BZC5_UNCW3|nr:MAG: 30S ribosomal protein S18 [candidate division WOR-3 bacterium JGI_Cruoil_03_44_89]
MNRKCYFCENKEDVDYKNVQVLKKFMTPSHKIMPRRLTKLCAKHQRAVQKAIKRARIIALLPFMPG